MVSELLSSDLNSTSDSLSLCVIRKPTVLCVFIVTQVNRLCQHFLNTFLIFVQFSQRAWKCKFFVFSGILVFCAK